MLTEDDFHSLCWLQVHWAEHYRIWLIEGTWYAQRTRHDGRQLSAGSARALRDKMKDDYAELAEAERAEAALAVAGKPPGSSIELERARLSKEDQSSLNWLRMHYEKYYKIDYITPAEDAAFWQAVWRAPGQPATLVADSEIGLRDLMRDDHARRDAARRRAERAAVAQTAQSDGPA